MEQAHLLQQLNSIVGQILKNESVCLTKETTAHDVDGWDSLTNALIIAAVEKHFTVHFRLKEILKLKNVGELCSLIQKKLN